MFILLLNRRIQFLIEKVSNLRFLKPQYIKLHFITYLSYYILFSRLCRHKIYIYIFNYLLYLFSVLFFTYYTYYTFFTLFFFLLDLLFLLFILFFWPSYFFLIFYTLELYTFFLNKKYFLLFAIINALNNFNSSTKGRLKFDTGDFKYIDEQRSSSMKL